MYSASSVHCGLPRNFLGGRFSQLKYVMFSSVFEISVADLRRIFHTAKDFFRKGANIFLSFRNGLKYPHNIFMFFRKNIKQPNNNFLSFRNGLKYPHNNFLSFRKDLKSACNITFTNLTANLPHDNRSLLESPTNLLLPTIPSSPSSADDLHDTKKQKNVKALGTSTFFSIGYMF